MRTKLAALLLALPSLLAADEHGTLVLHFLQLPVGEETYQLTSKPTDRWCCTLTSNTPSADRASLSPPRFT